MVGDLWRDDELIASKALLILILDLIAKQESARQYAPATNNRIKK
jgi:hypothetical protein